MKILIAGAAGFIGSNLASHLLQTTQNSVISMDDLSGTPDLDNLQFALGHKNERHKFYLNSTNDTVILKRIFDLEKPDVVINLTTDRNADSNLYEVAQTLSGFKRFISFSSEDADANRSLEKVFINTCHVFGPRQGPQCSIPRIIKEILESDSTESFHDAILEEYIYIKDLLDAIILVVGADQISKSIYIGGDVASSKYDICNFIQKLSCLDVETDLPPFLNQSFDVRLTSSEIVDMGWRVRRPIEQALEHTLQWYSLNKWALKE